jgi:hypothetical protein
MAEPTSHATDAREQIQRNWFVFLSPCNTRQTVSTEGNKNTFAALGLLGTTYCASVMYKVHVQALPHTARHECFKRIVVPLSPLRIAKLQAGEDPVNVGIYRKTSLVKRVGQDASR